MLKYTLKNFIEMSKSVVCNDEFHIIAKGNETGEVMEFIPSQNNIKVITGEGDFKIMQTFQNLDLVEISDDKTYTLISVESTTYNKKGGVFSKTLENISYEAQAFIWLFKRLREKIDVVFKHEGKIYNSYYIGAKIYIVSENANVVNITAQTLYKLNMTHPGYEILYISYPINRFSRKEYMMDLEDSSREKGKKLVMYKSENRLEV